MGNPFRYFNSSPEVIRLVVMMYVRFPLSLRNVEDLLAERGIDISHETVRFWWNRFGPIFAAEICKRQVMQMRGYPQWRWHLDEVFVRINGKLCYLWRAVDHEGEVLEAVVTTNRDKAAALKLLKRVMKKYGRPRIIVTDRLRAYSAAMNEIGVTDRHEVGRRLNNRAENSHQPFRRRERAMQRFRNMKTLQKFSSVHDQVRNHFNLERHLVARQVYKQRRLTALAEWRALAGIGCCLRTGTRRRPQTTPVSLTAPTQGVDIASKEALFAIVERARVGGGGVLIVSDELDELSGCDCVLVIFKGRLTEEFPAGWRSEKLVAAIEGIGHGEPAG